MDQIVNQSKIPLRQMLADIIADVEVHQEMTPHARLWLACLIDGCRSAAAGAEEDQRWLANNDYQPGSIKWICSAIGLDVTRVRAIVRTQGRYVKQRWSRWASRRSWQ